jgi:hypothetical protein
VPVDAELSLLLSSCLVSSIHDSNYPPHKRTSQLWTACGIRKFTGSTFIQRSPVHLPNSHTSSSFSPSYAFRCPHSAPTKPSPPLITAIPERAPAAAVSPRFFGQFHRVNTSRLSLVVLIFNILVPVEPEITVSPDPDQHLHVLLLPVRVLILTYLSRMGLLYLSPRIILARLTCIAKSYNYSPAGLSHITTTSMTIQTGKPRGSLSTHS